MRTRLPEPASSAATDQPCRLTPAPVHDKHVGAAAGAGPAAETTTREVHENQAATQQIAGAVVDACLLAQVERRAPPTPVMPPTAAAPCGPRHVAAPSRLTAVALPIGAWAAAPATPPLLLPPAHERKRPPLPLLQPHASVPRTGTQQPRPPPQQHRRQLAFWPHEQPQLDGSAPKPPWRKTTHPRCPGVHQQRRESGALGPAVCLVGNRG